MARDVNLPTLIREKRGFKRFTPADAIGRIEQHLITMNEAKLTQEISKLHEQLEKNNGVALKASQVNKGKNTLGSTSSKMKESDSDDDMALFIKRFNKVMKKNGYFNKNKKRGNINRKSNNPCFGCGQIGHFIADCPNPKNKNKSEKKEQGKSKTRHMGEARLGIEWDSSDESSDDEDVATFVMEARTTKSSLFRELTDDEDDFTHTCFMAKETKVSSSSSPDSDDEKEHSEFENMIKELGPKATNKIMKLMVEFEGRDEILETQEELLKLE